ncbi:MAG: PRC-barrel domain-containing protein [Planctomycetaceae bacterium]|nr:PRC-barrel domain-containing protein [Planctomycetaceae bacterium]
MFQNTRLVFRAGVVASAALLLTWAAFSYGQAAQPNMQAPAPGTALRAHDLLGTDVKNDRGEKVGSVKEIVLTPQRDRVDYVALSAGGKLFAVPWQAFRVTPERSLALNVEKNHFDNMQGFDSSHYPWQANMDWRNRAAQPVREAVRERAREAAGERYTQRMHLRKVSDIVGTAVRGSDDKKLGDIENLIIETSPATASPSAQPAPAPQANEPAVHVGVGPVNINVGTKGAAAPAPAPAAAQPAMMNQGEGFVSFAIVSYGGVLGVGEKMSAVPWNALNFDTAKDVARLNATKETLESTAFAKDRYPDFTDRQWAQGVYQKYNTEPYWQVYGYTGRPGETTDKAWLPDSDYNNQFSADKISTITGTIDSVSTFRPAANATPGERLRIQGEDGKAYIVQLGPRSFVDAKGLNLASGDKISVTGSHVEMEGRMVVMATELRKGDQTLQLRDRQGKPLWTERDLTTPSPSRPYDRSKMDSD